MTYYNPEQIAQIKDVGNYLQQQRLAHSLTLENVAERTFISHTVLRALEEGNTDELPEKIYVQGFIRRYADLLGIDGAELAKTLSEIPDTLPPNSKKHLSLQKEQLSNNNSTQTLTPPPTTPLYTSRSAGQKSGGMSKFLPFLLIVLAALSGLAGYLYMRRPVPETVVEVEPSPLIEPSPVIASPSPLPSPTLSPSPSPLKKDSPLTLSVQITERAWVRVTADGKTVYEGILLPGDQQKWTGKEEIRLLAGNAGGVKISLNEEPFEQLGQSGEVKTVNLKAETLNSEP